jgi:hypothetical protein
MSAFWQNNIKCSVTFKIDKQPIVTSDCSLAPTLVSFARSKMHHSSYPFFVDKRELIRIKYRMQHFAYLVTGKTPTMAQSPWSISVTLPGTMWFNKQVKELQGILLPPSSRYSEAQDRQLPTYRTMWHHCNLHILVVGTSNLIILQHQML